MSAADRMVVRTRDGSYRSFPRRTALGMISRGQATAATTAAPQTAAPAEVDPLGPHGDEYQAPVATDPTAGPALTGEPPAGTPLTFEELARVAAYEASPELTPEPARDLPGEPRGNASRQEWATYAVSLGVEVTADMTRNKIRDAAQDLAQTLDRLPQPALTGGRLETPEDEPVTGGSVTDDEDPGTR